jgi:hypothetical protein
VVTDLRKNGLAEFAQIAEIIAALAVVVSIFYVGIQLKANTAAIQSASVQAITNTSMEFLSVQNTNLDLSKIRETGDLDPSDLDPDDVYRYFILNRQVWLMFQNVYLQRDLGVVGSKLWGTYSRIICFELVKPGTVETWQSHARNLDPGFVAVVEACSTFEEFSK